MLINFLRNSFKINKTSGRNNQGKIVSFYKKKYNLKKKFKLVDLKRNFKFTGFRLVSFTIDFKKTCFLGLVYYEKFGLFSYILSSKNSKIGTLLSNSILIKSQYTGNKDLLKNIALGSQIFNISMTKYGDGLLARSAGTYGILFRKLRLKNNNEFVGIQLPSGLLIYISSFNFGVVGSSSNERQNTFCGLGARNLKVLNRRPRVRGVAMNPVDHPHGGGEGKTSGGRVSVSRWGKLAKGGKTLLLKKKYKRLKFLNKLKFNIIT